MKDLIPSYAYNVEKDFKFARMHSINFFLICLLIFKNLRDNLIIVLLFSFIILMSIFIYKNDITIMLTGVLCSILASIILIRPIDNFQKEKAYFKDTYILLVILNYSLNEVIKYAQMMLETNYLMNDCEKTLNLNWKIKILISLLNECEKKSEKEFSADNINKYKILQKDVNYRITYCFKIINFFHIKNLMISSIALPATYGEDKFILLHEIKDYKDFCSILVLLTRLFRNLKNTKFLEYLYNNFSYIDEQEKF